MPGSITEEAPCAAAAAVPWRDAPYEGWQS
jgi:hypothetical protein